MMKHYQRLTEKIFSKPAGERAQYLEEIRDNEMEFFKRIDHLISFLTTNDDKLEKFAHHQIKQILDDLSKE